MRQFYNSVKGEISLWKTDSNANYICLGAKQIIPTPKIDHPPGYSLLPSRTFTDFVTIRKFISAFYELSDPNSL